uniref:Uncharacterized protein n=1 Tax=Amphiprion percula TaxID=161767 RepID=A0A3P8RTM2_AMPPE
MSCSAFLQKQFLQDCAVLLREDHFIYYLVTKQRAFHKPTYNSLLHSLEDMRSHCIWNGVHKLSMPRIGCGLDQLEWILSLIFYIFMDTGITITAFLGQQHL